MASEGTELAPAHGAPAAAPVAAAAASSNAAASSASSRAPSLLLHHAAFRGDARELRRLLELQRYDADAVDALGNTALHLAVMLRHQECIDALLAHKASVNIKNRSGWSALHEAVSLGDRDVLRQLWLAFKARIEAQHELSGLLSHLRSLPDFRATFAWKTASWIPFLGRFLPADSLQLSKRGGQIRIDCSMLEFKGMKWHYHPFSFLIMPRIEGVSTADAAAAAAAAVSAEAAAISGVDAAGAAEAVPTAESIASAQHPREPILVFTLDHVTRQWQCVNKSEEEDEENRQPQDGAAANAAAAAASSNAAAAASSAAVPAAVPDVDLEYEVDDFLSMPLTSAFSPGQLRFRPMPSRSWTSWRGWSAMLGIGQAPPRVERVGHWDATVFAVEDVRVHMLKRFEHLSTEEREELLKSQSDFRALWSNPAKLRRELAEKEREEAEQAQQEADDDFARHPGGDTPEARSRREKDAAAEAAMLAAPKHRPSLPPPPPPPVSFAAYFHTGNQRAFRAAEMEELLDAARNAAVDQKSSAQHQAQASAAHEEELELKEDDDDETSHGQERSANHDANTGDAVDDDELIAASSASASSTASAAAASAAAPASVPAPSAPTSAPWCLHLGRPVLQQESRKKYSARLWMASGFPLQMGLIVEVAELLFGSTYPQVVGKLRHFVSQRLPPGFPVKLVVPVLPVLSVEVSIREFSEGAAARYAAVGVDAAAERSAAEQYFSIPRDYTREELSEEEMHKRQQKYRKRWKAADVKKRAADKDADN